MIGSTISHYRILEQLGEGGMGVVYKAEDLKLERRVALKFLAAHLLNDDEAKARFLREAKAAAALHHPNICPVYEIDEADGKTFLAMAFLKGETLEDRIAKGPLPLKDALDLGRQVAEGLQAAHAEGIVHRDIKPANILVSPEGRATVMDFGLARLTEASKLTRADQTVGTAAYMSPEQMQGLEVDHRTDIWAHGCVLYEMVAGLRPFKGEYDQALAYEIVHEEPEPLTGVRAGVPMELEFIVGKCLAKDVADRYENTSEIGRDLRTLGEKLRSGRSTILSTTAAAASQTARPAPEDAVAGVFIGRRSLRALQALAAILSLAFAGLLAVHLSAPEPERTVRRFSFTPESFFPPEEVNGYPQVVISPDGRWIAHVSFDAPSMLWVRPIDREEPRMLEGTEGAVAGMFWSPDNKSIGFVSGGQLKKISVAGGPPTVICDYDLPIFGGGFWSEDGEIVFGWRKAYEIPAGGGEPREIASLNDQSSFSELSLLPSRTPILLSAVGRRLERSIFLRNLETGDMEKLVEGSNPIYSPTGHILYQTAPVSSGLWALPFSLERLEATGDPFLVAEGVVSASLAADGTLAAMDSWGSERRQQLVWRDRHGARLEEMGQPQERIRYPAMSPDGRWVAVNGRETYYSGSNVWLHEVGRSVKQKFTLEQELNEVGGSWTPKGQGLTFARGELGGSELVTRRLNGGEEQILLRASSLEHLKLDRRFAISNDWSPDGRDLLYTNGTSDPGGDLWLVHLDADGEPGEPQPFLATPFEEGSPQFSPDGRYVAYVSNESGKDQVFVRDFPGGQRRWQASTDGGAQPRWSSDGKKLYFVEGNVLMEVRTELSPEFVVGEPEQLFASRDLRWGYDVSDDGRFVMVEDVIPDSEELRKPAIHITENWYEEFRGREQD